MGNFACACIGPPNFGKILQSSENLPWTKRFQYASSMTKKHNSVLRRNYFHLLNKLNSKTEPIPIPLQNKTANLFSHFKNKRLPPQKTQFGNKIHFLQGATTNQPN